MPDNASVLHRILWLILEFFWRNFFIKIGIPTWGRGLLQCKLPLQQCIRQIVLFSLSLLLRLLLIIMWCHEGLCKLQRRAQPQSGFRSSFWCRLLLLTLIRLEGHFLLSSRGTLRGKKLIKKIHNSFFFKWKAKRLIGLAERGIAGQEQKSLLLSLEKSSKT